MQEVKLTLENIDTELRVSQGVLQLVVLELQSQKAELEKKLFQLRSEEEKRNDVALIAAAKNALSQTPKAKEAIGKIQLWLDSTRSIVKKIDAGGMDTRFKDIFDKLLEIQDLIEDV
jgi:hypothetical protein